MMVFGKPFWEVLLQPAVLPFFLLAVIDGAMTVVGTFEALGGSSVIFSLIAGLIVGVGVMITLLCTFDIWGAWHPVLQESTFITWLLRGLWGVAFFYDWGTSAWGFYKFVGSEGSPLQLVGIAGAGLVVCGSTLVISFMTYNERRENVGSASR